MRNPIVLATILTGLLLTLLADPASGSKTGWSPRIIATGEFKEKIEATPIELRPNRPLHFYGNTVRRRHYRSLKASSQRSTKAQQKTASKKRD